MGRQPLENSLSKLEGLVIIKNDKPRCQYSETCNKSPLEKEAFCEEHITFPLKMKTRLSGSEPPYESDRWNTEFVQRVHNCFAYALNILSTSMAEACKTGMCNTHQPGAKSMWPNINEKTCTNIITRVLGDDTYIATKFEDKCPRGKSMIAFIVDTKRDYHVLRLDNNGYFSHKGGQGPATNLDAKGHLIADVRLANFNYSDKPEKLNYTNFCGYFCISRKHINAAVPKGGRKTRRRQKSRTRLLRRRTGK